MSNIDYSKIIFPLQPIVDRRFVENRIVTMLMEKSGISLNDIACMDFSDAEREQFNQLIGYSVYGLSELSSTSFEAAEAARLVSKEGLPEHEARLRVLRNQLEEVKKGVRDAAVALFCIHPDDLE